MKTLLYIEDNLDNLKVLQLMLNRLRPDDDVLAATTAIEGLRIAGEKQPDLILMDIDLPDMDGYMALSALRADTLTRHIPVLAVSAHAMLGNIQKGLAAGFDAYITKPVDMRRLNDVINHYLPAAELAGLG